MTEQDKESWLGFYAGLAMMGLIIRGDTLDVAKAWYIGEEMIKGFDREDEGIVAIKKRTRRKHESD